MKKNLKHACLSIFLCVFFMPLLAQAFIIKRIEVRGIQRISKGTVLNYLPVRVGDEINQKNTALIIQALYKTGFFSNIRLEQNSQTLVIKVTEQATIGHITISGNKLIKTDKLTDALKDLGFVKGRVYNQALFENIKQSLEREYFSQGLYNASVDMHLIPKDRNRVAIEIKIHEGRAAKIKEIRIIGNKAFRQPTLLHVLSLSSSRLWSFFTHNDRYSRERLDADIEQLRSFYLDRGYIKFNVVSSEVSLSPNREQVHIIIHIEEGEQFHLAGYQLAWSFDCS